MPELPEVESTVRGLSQLVTGRKITDVWSDWPKIVRGKDFKSFQKGIIGRKIVSLSRRAKNILFHLDEDFLLLVHLKMTGHLMVGQWTLPDKGAAQAIDGGALSEKVNGYIHMILVLDDGRMIALSDLRKFAKVRLGKESEVFKEEKFDQIGPEATEITLLELSKLASKSKKAIKSVLMDQEKIAGIGNIYSDDILWKAKINPLRPALSLTDKEIKDLFEAIKSILSLALKLRGTSISDYRDVFGEKGGYGDQRLIYRRDKEPCKRCGSSIKRIKIGGRSARYCPICQKI
ncbi:MAG: DNA-formamidopyrimidine glycosylase [Candidatus Colwellbacteria bacterium]|nr:DNA-formamidopyrimidine glycosylase [Candidatus Colwellbacteria bacterium]